MSARSPGGGVPRTVKGLSVVSLFNDLASEMVYPLLPALVTGPLGGGALVLGLLDGAAELTSAALKVVSGRLADRPGWRGPLILVGYATAVLVRPLIAVAGAAWQVVGFRVIDRVGKGLRTPARDAWIAAVTPPDLRGRAFGFHRAADHFGAVLGSVVAWLLLERGLGVRDVIGWSAVPGLLVCLVLLPLLRRPSPMSLPAEPSTARPVDATGRVFWAPVLLLAALTFLRLPEALLLLRLQDLGVAGRLDSAGLGRAPRRAERDVLPRWLALRSPRPQDRGGFGRVALRGRRRGAGRPAVAAARRWSCSSC